jgi:glycine/D-amino acid oxidase-like deaminating enzyme
VGAGASGVPAALSALENGASVAVLQKENIAISQGNSGAGIDFENSAYFGHLFGASR